MPRLPAAGPPGPAGASDTVAVRPASTVVLARDGEHRRRPLEVLLLRRRADSGFVPGAHVFPGGAVDPDDALFVPPEGLDLTAAAAAAALGIDDPATAVAHWVAAVRETFEECGALLAHRPGHHTLELAADPDLAVRLVAHRRQVDAGTRSLADVLAAEGLVPALGQLHYLARWITPLGAPRRYDTRFFVARAPEDHDLGPDGTEVTELSWMRPAAALEAHRDGEIDLILPTQRTLELIERYPRVDDLLGDLAGAADGRHVDEPGGGWRVPLGIDRVDPVDALAPSAGATPGDRP